MNPSELANKIAEEVFRTIEREKAIIKAEVVEAVERVLAKELRNIMAAAGGGFIGRGVSDQVVDAYRTVKLGEWKIISKEDLAAQQREAQVRYEAILGGAVSRLSAIQPATPLKD
jgi:hypothetical protein